jgi:ribosomal protein RSM22 (predicted rRNA methylase)
MTDLTPGLKEVLSSYHALRGPVRMGSIAEGVSYLTRMLTGQLPFRPGYMSRRDLRRAYVEYYLPINAAKIARILDELATVDGEFLREELRVLDFGSGPGTASLAWRLWGGKVSSHVLVDRVEEALDEAEALLGASFERAGEILPGPYDLVFASNVFVESESLGDLDELLRQLDPRGYLVVLEPAMERTTRRLMEARDRLVAEGWKIAAPCMGASRCPMRDRTDLWCHQDRGWSGPRSISEIDRRTGLDNARSLRYSYLVVTRDGKSLADRNDWRVVSNLHRGKGKVWAELCGSGEKLWSAEALRRHRSSALKPFFHAQRGDLLRLEGPSGGRIGPGHRFLPPRKDSFTPPGAVL